MLMRYLKQKTYNFITHWGIGFLRKCFPEYFASEPLEPTDRYIEYPFVLENLPLPSYYTVDKKKILDVGCSGSMFPLILKSIGHLAYGIDIRNYHPENKFFFIQGDIKCTMFDSGFFDIVTAVSSLEHIGLKGRYGIHEEDMDGDIMAVKEIHRILKPKGLLLMTVPCGEYLQITHNHKIYTLSRINRLLQGFDYDYTLVKSNEAEYELCLVKAVKS